MIADTGHWEYPNEFDYDEWFGFIYRIIHTQTGREYLGKKQFHSYTRKKIKGRKNRKKIIKESNWKKYTGSSKQLNNDIEEFGKDQFKFIIESLHETRGSLFYAEVEKQVKENVLRETLDNGDRRYYNGHIGSVKFLPPMETLNESHHRINK